MKIFFYLKPHFRERQWDTVRNLPPGFFAILPKDVSPLGSENTYFSVRHEQKHRSLKRRILSTLPLLNLRQIPAEADEADALYTFGYLPWFTKKPFFLELDNPYTMTFYRAGAAQLYKPAIRHYLSKAKKIICLSKTCQAHLMEEYGEEFREKTVVHYPFITAKKVSRRKEDGTLRFLFLGLHFRTKGGPEALAAFHHSKGDHLRLTVISDVPQDVKARYSKDSRISFLSAMPREKLFTEIYPEHDVLLFPSLYESFGMAILEALSFGLGIIATNVYAVPEMVDHEKNGLLLTHPCIRSQMIGGRKMINPLSMTLGEFEIKYGNPHPFFDSLYQEIKNAIEESRNRSEVWKEASLRLFNERFSPDLWKRKMDILFHSTLL